MKLVSLATLAVYVVLVLSKFGLMVPLLSNNSSSSGLAIGAATDAMLLCAGQVLNTKRIAMAKVWRIFTGVIGLIIA